VANLKKMTVAQLQKLCKKEGIEGYEDMKKSDLIAVLESVDEEAEEAEVDEEVEDEDEDWEDDEDDEEGDDEDEDDEDDDDWEEDEDEDEDEEDEEDEDEEDEDEDDEDEEVVEEKPKKKPSKKASKARKEGGERLRPFINEQIDLNAKLKKKNLWVKNAQFLSRDEKKQLLKAKNQKDPIAKKVYKLLDKKVAGFRSKQKEKTKAAKTTTKAASPYADKSHIELAKEVVKRKLKPKAEAKKMSDSKLIKLLEFDDAE